MNGSSGSNGRVFWTAAVLVLILDIVSKQLAVRYLMPQHVPHDIIGNVVRFTLAFNPGAAFSMWLGPHSRYIFGAFALIALAILWRLYRTTLPGDTVRVLALGLAWGGAAGNLADRFRESRGVVDFIDIGVGNVRFWTFNVADSAVTVGALLLAFVLWREDRRELAMQAAEAAARDFERVPESRGADAPG
ncbi:MAG TPA: signal peptidase II [Gemmatimonadaceae bacterium]|jgi:signal peptidase II|nr:signal peptidase II [Gemmatimonadaceae bacterium]